MDGKARRTDRHVNRQGGRSYDRRGVYARELNERKRRSCVAYFVFQIYSRKINTLTRDKQLLRDALSSYDAGEKQETKRKKNVFIKSNKVLRYPWAECSGERNVCMHVEISSK